MGIHWEEQGLTFSQIKRKTPVLRPALQSNQSSLCCLHCSRDQRGGGSNGQVISINRAADGRRQRNRKIIDKKRKVQGQERILAEHLDGLKRSDFCDFENHPSASIKTKNLSPTSKARREEESRRVRRLFHLMDGNNRRCHTDGKKGL